MTLKDYLHICFQRQRTDTKWILIKYWTYDTINSIGSHSALTFISSLGASRSTSTTRQQDREAEAASDSSGAGSDLETLFWPNRKKTKPEQTKPKPTKEQLDVSSRDNYLY